MVRALVIALCLFPLPALAQDAPVLAIYYADSGSLPPEIAWETNVTIYEDGRLTLRRCTGYETEGPACKDRKAKVPPAALDAIRKAALASGLADTPATQTDDPQVGGGVTGGAVYVEGVKLSLPSEPISADAPRVAEVLRAVQAAIPQRFDRFFLNN